MESAREESHYMEDGSASGETRERAAFVSRRKPGRESDQGAGPEDLPGLRDGRMLWLLLLTVALQVFAWTLLRGYQLADSVEFMDRAYSVARGDSLDSTGAVRGFGFSTFLLPFFALAEAVELENMRWVVHTVRALQMALGLGLVFLCARLGARLAGRRVGFVAGYLVAINPIFLQYSVDPVSGIAAAFFVALGLNLLITQGSLRRSLLGGLSLGAAFMMAYQTLLISVPLIVLLFLRDRRSPSRSWLGASLGAGLALVAQITLDKLTYDSWGISVKTYLFENGGGVLFSLAWTLGLGDAQWVRDAYEGYIEVVADGAEVAEGGARGSLQSPYFYLQGLGSMLVYPVLALGALGLFSAWKNLNWKTSILFVVLAINVYAMSLKGSKSFRLWLPLLPMIAPLCALGWGCLLRTQVGGSVSVWRRLASAALLLSSLVLGVRALQDINTRRYGTYWDAIDYVSERSHGIRLRVEGQGGEFSRQTVGSAYNWAVFCRSSSDVRVTKFKAHLDQWGTLPDDQREVVISQMDRMDWLVVHGTILRLSPDLTNAINERFEVIASFWDEDTNPSIRDVRVLRNLARRGDPDPRADTDRPRRLFEVIEIADPAAYRERWNLDQQMIQPAHFIGERADGDEEHLQLLGFEYEMLPAAGFGWITYHWYSETALAHDYTITDRISTLECPWSWQNNHTPAYGVWPTSRWIAGHVLREGYLVAAGSKPFTERFSPLGGPYRRGDLLPARLWINVSSPPGSEVSHAVLPAAAQTRKPLNVKSAKPSREGGLLTPEGYVVSRDHLLLVAKFLIPVSERSRWPDDGGPGPDAGFYLAEIKREKERLAREAARAEQ